ncbi:PREDICTED: uncharacterized protein LOC106742339 [Dinoponera quadriceps]|uniref:Uncharacterized protein LOC106742339 n=1 Tax=Dinoponera quadriceps TaxID=609295 RepID=A0A6P3WYH6_DINQU|nr:PREDICTED: uncharacterized protein LOC106742339 [Dinoponera quadriceps]
MKLSEIVHKRQIDISLRSKVLFRFQKLHQKLYYTDHSAARIVIQEKWKDIEEKQFKNRHQIEAENLTEDAENGINTINYKMYYARDDLDDIENVDGHDTLATTSSFVLRILACLPEIQVILFAISLHSETHLVNINVLNVIKNI